MTPFAAAFRGSLAADALSMPVHWYYDREALKRDYGLVDHFMAPRNPFPNSFMAKASYTPVNEKADILHDQARFYGQKDIHYHQCLKAGENTLNFKLARELYALVKERGGYEADAWLERYVGRMLEPGWHGDTYVEECHRAFFTNYANGKPLRECGIPDKHIGGLATVPALLAGLEGRGKSREELRAIVREHVNLTHKHEGALGAADTLVCLLWEISEGANLRDAIRKEGREWLSADDAEAWIDEDDLHVVGARFSAACYVEDSMPSSLYLAWKYEEDFAAGIVANAMCGGDNCHRGAVAGSLLAAANGGVPEKFRVEDGVVFAG